MSLSGSLLAAIPSPDQGEWQVGPVTIRAYVLCVLVGVAVAIVWGGRRWVARGGRNGAVLDVAALALPLGLIGGRLQHVAAERSQYFSPDRDPWDAVKVWEGGLGIGAAVVFAAVGAWIACRWHRVRLPALADAVAPGVLLASALGGLGSWFNEEIEGAPTSLPWGLEVYRRVDPASGLADPVAGVAVDHTPLAVVHPVFLYELLWNAAIALVVVWAERTFRMGRGRAFALAVAGFVAGQAWIDVTRTEDVVLAGRVGAVASLLVFVLAVAYLVFARAGDPVGSDPVPGRSPRTAALGEVRAARRDLAAKDDKVDASG